MSGSTSLLDTISANQSQKEVTANALFNAASPATLFAYRASTSVGLVWGYYGGTFRKGDGSFVSIANGTLTLQVTNVWPYVTPNYIEVDYAGTISSNLVGFTAGRIPLYLVNTQHDLPSATQYVVDWADYRTGTQGHFKQWDRIVASQSYAATINVDLSPAPDIVRITLTGSPTINFTQGGDGQLVTLELTQDASGGHTVNWGAMCHFSADLPVPTLSTDAGAMDRIAFQVMAGSPSRYDCVAFLGGF